MDKISIAHFFVGAFLLMLVTNGVNSKPLTESEDVSTTKSPEIKSGRNLAFPDEELLVLAPLNEVDSGAENDMKLVPVPIQIVQKQDDGEMLETANTMTFMPLFAYRRIQSQRRRVYAPRRSYYDRHFPTLA